MSAPPHDASPDRAAAGHEERLLAVYEMIRALNSESDPDLLLESILDMALRVVRAERGLILLRSDHDGEHTVRLARNLEAETIRDVVDFSRDVVLRAGDGQSVFAANTGNDIRLRGLRSVRLYDIRSLLCVPLRLRGRIIGAVYLDSRGDGVLFSDDDLRFLEAFADHAALALENARTRSRLQRHNRRLQVAAERRSGLEELVGRSPAMQRVYDLIEKVAETNLPVLIQGESGTGKELVARAIHQLGPRRRRPFVSENSASIPATLMESELFGHVRGAYTGAERDRRGLFEQADGGTLFLDEIGDMSVALQARLLRVLEAGEVRPVGGEARRHVDVRLLAATHHDLHELLDQGRFREDLLYRLLVVPIHVPPLRERPGDVPPLVEHFLARIAGQRGRKPPVIRAVVMDLLERCPWPGNVRQLENTLQRLSLQADDGLITLRTIEDDPTLRQLLARSSGAPTPILSLKHGERERVREALRATAGNREQAARLLGVSRATIFRKIKQFDLRGQSRDPHVRRREGSDS